MKTQVFNSLSECQNTLKARVNVDTDSSTVSNGCRTYKGMLQRFKGVFFFFFASTDLNKDICFQVYYNGK